MKASANMQPHEKSVLKCIYQWQIVGVKDVATGRTVRLKRVPDYLVTASLCHDTPEREVSDAFDSLTLSELLNDQFMAYIGGEWQLPDNTIIRATCKFDAGTYQWAVANGKKTWKGHSAASEKAIRDGIVTRDDCNAYRLTKAGIELIEKLTVPDARDDRQCATTSRDAQTSGNIDNDANLSPSKLAEIFGVELNALQQRLKRWRRKNHVGWIEVTDRCSREAQYLYRVGTVRQLVEKMKTTSETTSKRPAKK